MTWNKMKKKVHKLTWKSIVIVLFLGEIDLVTIIFFAHEC